MYLSNFWRLHNLSSASFLIYFIRLSPKRAVPIYLASRDVGKHAFLSIFVNNEEIHSLINDQLRWSKKCKKMV